jgi:hypothetical protein
VTDRIAFGVNIQRAAFQIGLDGEDLEFVAAHLPKSALVKLAGRAPEANRSNDHVGRIKAHPRHH